MFGLFGKKTAKPATMVAPQVAAQLKAQAALPATFAPQPAPSFPACALAHFRGEPPKVQWAAEPESGETRRTFIIPGSGATPPLAVLTGGGDKLRVQMWELSRDREPRFVRERPIAIDPDQNKWLHSSVQAVSCLPGGLTAIAIAHHSPIPRDSVYIYDAGANTFRPLGRIEPDISNGPPFVPFETLVAAPDAMLIAYHTGQIRLGPSNYAYEYDHLMLFSKRHPRGLEILKLAVDDGNLRGWRMDGTTLWLQTQDKRKKPRDFIWSLDLNNVL